MYENPLYFRDMLIATMALKKKRNSLYVFAKISTEQRQFSVDLFVQIVLER